MTSRQESNPFGRGLSLAAALCLVLMVAVVGSVGSDAAMAADPVRIIYVDADATGRNDGSSWADAYRYLQDALADASDSQEPMEIRVAQGVYRPDRSSIYPDGTGDRTTSFCLLDSVAVKGGFAGAGGADPNARDVDRYETILSGDLGDNDVNVSDPCDLLNEPSRSDNSYHVITACGTEPNAVLDGFTITGGNAKSIIPPPQPTYSPHGAGMYIVSGSPTVMNCRFTSNLAGAGGAIYTSQSHPVLINCTFTSNMAGQVCTTLFVGRDPVIQCSGGHGGAVHSASGSPRISGCIFTGNLAIYGGGISNGESSPVFEDCLFLRNAAHWGGGVYYARSSPTMVRCTFRSNVASEEGGAMANKPVINAVLTDCVFAENWAKDAGGAIDNSSADLSLVRCTFTKNRTPSRGGAMYNWNSKVRLFNCLLNDNVGVLFGGGAVYNDHGNTLTLANCTLVSNSGKYANGFVFRGNRSAMQLANCIVRNGAPEIANEDNSVISIEYTNITGGWPGEGNIDADPLFAAPGYCDPNGTPDDPNDDFWVDGDYHLKSQGGRWDPATESWVKDEVMSSCIDAGDPNSPIGQEPFPNGGRINMGAYGGTGEASKSYFGEPVCETIIAGDINGDCRVDFRDFEIMSLHWLQGQGN